MAPVGGLWRLPQEWLLVKEEEVIASLAFADLFKQWLNLNLFFSSVHQGRQILTIQSLLSLSCPSATPAVASVNSYMRALKNGWDIKSGMNQSLIISESKAWQQCSPVISSPVTFIPPSAPVVLIPSIVETIFSLQKKGHL